jgi:hypothetical protein
VSLRLGEHARDGRVGDAVTAALPAADGAGEDGREHRAVDADERSAGVSRTHEPAQRREQPADRPAAVGVVGEHRLRAPNATRAHVERPVLGIAEDRAAATGRRFVRQAQARQPQAWHAQHGYVVGRVEGDRTRRQARRASVRLHGRVALAGDDVRIGDHRVRAGDPSRTLDRQPTCRAEDAHDAARRRFDAGRARDARRRRGHVRRRSGDRRQRVQARQRVEDRAGGRQQHVQLLQDRRALDVRAQVLLIGRLRDDGGDDPHDAERERRSQRRSEQAVEHADAGKDQRATHPEGDPLHAAGEDRAGEQRTEQAERRRVGRGGAFVEQ